MVEVTDEMIDAAMRYFNNSENAKQSDRDWIAGVIKISIELHEANKPKPEPVGFISFKYGGWLVKPHEAERMKNIDTEFQPLYTTPPTREPLSEHEVNNILFNLSKGNTLFDFARLVEQAHGIGEKQ